ncbi:MAG: histidinol dehydrogenase [bacterium]|nr:histidinol dehydrogenase [bacterium]MDE0286952.1 histidinol dehydrogenase [bacterium]
MRVRRLADLDPGARRELVNRSAVPDREVRRSAAGICRSIEEGGDRALAYAGIAYGGGRSDPRVGTAEISTALRNTDRSVRRALEEAIDSVQRHHQAQIPESVSHETRPGVRIDRRWTPLRRVGAYIPGGKASYPSSLVMTAVPAQVAGVGEIVVASPCDEDGSLDRTLLAAAALLGVDEVYAMGGAQAVAALAFGTETIRRVDKIVGPGNAWVTAAKLEVYGTCAIDLPAGPSEVLVVADHTADPRLVAIDLLCQAEHGPDSPALVITTDPDLAARVEAEIAGFLPLLPRRDILRSALATHGEALLASSLDEALDFANAYAPEHASVLTADADSDAGRLVNAGSVYVGRWSPESAGDYATGANHVLPTGGLARSHGPLGVEDFGSWRQVQTLTRAGLESIRPVIEELAAAEGLDAHRMAASIRFETAPAATLPDEDTNSEEA